jgi:hypothetical protein
LFHAILSDFDVSTADGLQDARNTLDAIKQNAEAEEATGFDPSGSSTFVVGPAASENADQSSSTQGDSARYGASTATSALDSVGVSESEIPQSTGLDVRIESLSLEDKQALLAETFPDISAFTVCHTLRKCRENFEKAVDELLTAEYFAGTDENLVPKGIDGFAQNADFKRPKGKRRKDKHTQIALSTLADDAPVTNKWDRASQEITFVTERTTAPASTVASCYHAAGASLSKTILTLAKDESASKSIPAADEPSIQAEAVNLAAEFPDIAVEDLTGILRLAHPSTATVHELAKATIRNPFPVFERHSETAIVPSYTRLKVDDSLSDTSSESSWTRKDKARSKGTSPHATALANSYSSARQEAFAKASAAYRKSRSDPLMGGVAGYYASVARDAQAMAEVYSAEAADALAARQSTTKSVDLHGVDVANAVRIARERVDQWWTGGAAEWARKGKVMGGDGFSIVTGAGKHSQGGKGRIGPAVKKSLASEGWALDDYDGVVLVRGKVRR